MSVCVCVFWAEAVIDSWSGGRECELCVWKCFRTAGGGV